MLYVVIRLVWTATLVVTLQGCATSGDGRAEILVFAGASLAGVLQEIEAKFEEHGQSSVAISYGGSQMLAQQIASGAPADLLISAGEFPVWFLEERGLSGSMSTELVTNTLVVAVRSEGGLHLTSMVDLETAPVRRIAVADSQLAPAGRYAKEALTNLGMWDDVQHKLVFAADVRATLAYVESGNSDAALVYRTDAEASDKVDIMDIVPPDSYTPISYPAVVIDGSKNGAAAEAFLRFLTGKEAREIFRKFGFKPSRAD